MDVWQEYIKHLVDGYDGDNLTPPSLSLEKRQAILKAWNDYCAECKGKRKPSFRDCLDTHGSDAIYKGYQLLQLVLYETAFSKLIHNMKEQAAKKDGKRKSKTQSCRNAK